MNPNLSQALLPNIPWSIQTPSIWIATSLTLKRNFARFHFPSKMQGSEKQQVFEILKSTLSNFKGAGEIQFIEEEKLTPGDKELIHEHFLYLKGFQQTLSGSGIAFDNKGILLVAMNAGNHLELRALAPGGNIEAARLLLTQLEAALAQKSPFAFSSKFGFLTSDPTQCGTGLIVKSYLHLPAIIHSGELARLLPKEEDEAEALGLTGDLEELVGDLVILRNKYTLGVTEEATIQAIQTMSLKLVSAERARRTALKEKQDSALKDLISKAYGLLIHSYQLEIKEALDYLSLIKLGLDLGWITGLTDQKMSELFFKVRRGHLAYLFPDVQEPKELEHKRAEFLHKELQGLQLASNLL